MHKHNILLVVLHPAAMQRRGIAIFDGHVYNRLIIVKYMYVFWVATCTFAIAYAYASARHDVL